MKLGKYYYRGAQCPLYDLLQSDCYCGKGCRALCDSDSDGTALICCKPLSCSFNRKMVSPNNVNTLSPGALFTWFALLPKMHWPVTYLFRWCKVFFPLGCFCNLFNSKSFGPFQPKKIHFFPRLHSKMVSFIISVSYILFFGQLIKFTNFRYPLISTPLCPRTTSDRCYF